MSNFNLIIYKNISLYNLLKELNEFFTYDLKNHVEDMENLIKIINENPEFLVITDNKINNKINHICIDKPVKIKLLLEKISIKLSKLNFKNKSNLMVGEYTLDINSRFLSKNHNELKLTQKEVEIIYYLKNSEYDQPPEKLQKEIWNHSDGVETHTVETHIYRLRKKINEKFKDKNFIINNKTGYKLKN
tara:strand:- start:1125 stop:1691 length:567 start_codon:yes stop_codon:yes gene_type:complete